MQNNPFAKLFYDKFHQEVLNKCVFYGKNETIEKSSLENKFMERFNRFLERCGQQPIDTSHHYIPDKKLAQFCADLRYYMIRNIQDLPERSNKYSQDKDLVSLFDSSAQYLIARSRQYRMQGRHIPQVSDIYDYTVWKVSFTDTRGHIKMIPSNLAAKPNMCNLFIFDPSRCPDNEQLAAKQFHHDMQDIFHGSKHDKMKTYFIHLPPSYPEEVAVANILTTMRYPEEYTEADMKFAQQRWGNYLGKNLKYNEDNEVLSGSRYSDEDFIDNMNNMIILSYCAATADAHRCLKAFKNLAEQIYEPEIVKQAMKQVTLLSYAMMPLEKNPDYRGVYFMSNDILNEQNPEHVVMTNSPDIYQQIHVTRKDLQTVDSKITETPAGDYIVASPMPENSIQIDKEGKLVDKLKDKNARAKRLSLDTNIAAAKAGNLANKEWRDGHRLQNSTSANLGHVNHIMFKTVFNNALAGKSGADLFGHAATLNNERILSPAIAYARRHKLKE